MYSTTYADIIYRRVSTIKKKWTTDFKCDIDTFFVLKMIRLYKPGKIEPYDIVHIINHMNNYSNHTMDHMMDHMIYMYACYVWLIWFILCLEIPFLKSQWSILFCTNRSWNGFWKFLIYYFFFEKFEVRNWEMKLSSCEIPAADQSADKISISFGEYPLY